MIKTYKVCTTFLLVMLLAISSTFAQVSLNKVGQSTMNFLTVGTSARASALGEAYTALGSGSEAMFYNPAGITDLKGTGDVIVNYTQWIADIKYLSGAATYNL